MRVLRYLGAGVVAAAAALSSSAVSIVNDFPNRPYYEHAV